MHDNRLTTEGRISRALRDRLVAAIHGPTWPLEVSVWHVPGEPAPLFQIVTVRLRPRRPG
jgi:alpha-mannosidase